MDDDELRFSDDRQSPLDTLVTLRAALDDSGAIPEQGRGVIDPPRRGGDYHPIDHTRGDKTLDRVLQQGPTTQFDKSFGHAGSETITRTGGRNDRDRTGHRCPQVSQEAAARTSSRMVMAFASSVFSASASSPTRI